MPIPPPADLHIQPPAFRHLAPFITYPIPKIRLLKSLSPNPGSTGGVEDELAEEVGMGRGYSGYVSAGLRSFLV